MNLPGSQSRLSVVSIYGLLFLGVIAISIATLPGVTVLEQTSVYDIVSGGALFDLSTLTVSGGLVIAGVAAIIFGMILAAARAM